MNFLAHLWLADRTGTSLAGSVLGDVARGADLSAYPADIALGIRLHRKIDASCDRHPCIVSLRQQFPPGGRRYSGIVLDLAADHALICRWHELGPEPLRAFTQRCGLAIDDASEWFEKAGGRTITASSFAQLLDSYGSEDGMQRAITRTAARLRDPQALIEAARDWPRWSRLLAPQLEPLLVDLAAALQSM